MRRGSLPRATKPRPTPDRATGSHNHVEVVATAKGRVDLGRATGGAHSVPVGPTGASNLCDHDRVAGRAPIETPPVILIGQVGCHENIMTEIIVHCNKYLCDATKARTTRGPRPEACRADEGRDLARSPRQPRQDPWSKTNKDWENVCIIANSVVSNRQARTATKVYIKAKLDMELTDAEKRMIEKQAA